MRGAREWHLGHLFCPCSIRGTHSKEVFNQKVLSSPLGWVGEWKEGISGTRSVPTTSHPDQHHQRWGW